MSVDEMIVQVRALPRSDQLRIVNAIRDEISLHDRELVARFQGVAEIPMHSPVEAYETAAEMMRLRELAGKQQ